MISILGNVSQCLNPNTSSDIHRLILHDGGKEVAVKQRRSGHLELEHQIYKIVDGITGIPRLIDYKDDKVDSILILELCGKSLDQLFAQCRKQFSLKTVLMLADQMLARLQYLHTKLIVHGNIKPENFVMGSGRLSNVLYLIDFANVTMFGSSNLVLLRRATKRFSIFESINSLKQIEPSYGDDLESLGIMLIYFLRGTLPWINANQSNLLQIRNSCTVDQLCTGTPPHFLEYMYIITNLKYGEKPDYTYLRELFRKLMTKHEFVFDHRYEWVVQPKLHPSTSSIGLRKQTHAEKPVYRKHGISDQSTMPILMPGRASFMHRNDIIYPYVRRTSNH